jgi:16S rRNA (guanine1207-N2)-methyltransferase
VTAGIRARYDFIVSNPPFHSGQRAQPTLGLKFLEVARSALKPGGELWFVANRKLPYESALRSFANQRLIAERGGFKVVSAQA